MRWLLCLLFPAIVIVLVWIWGCYEHKRLERNLERLKEHERAFFDSPEKDNVDSDSI